VENLGNERIAAGGRDVFNVTFLNEPTVCHTAGRPNFEAVVAKM
jgi:hypothetical protein